MKKLKKVILIFFKKSISLYNHLKQELREEIDLNQFKGKNKSKIKSKLKF